MASTVIYLWLSRSAVEHLEAVRQDETVCVELARHLRSADTFGEPAPRSVLYTDDGDGLHFVAVNFFHESHADRAWEMLTEETLRVTEETPQLPLTETR